MHELMHTLGVFHEQSRNDRDEYIQVKYENIRSGNSERITIYLLTLILLITTVVVFNMFY